MPEWKMGSKAFSDGSRELTLDLQADGVSGTVSGTVTFKGQVYTMSGGWAAEGSVAGRNDTVFAISGANTANGAQFMALAGTVTGEVNSSAGMDVNLVLASSTDASERSWGGSLLAV